MILLKDQLEHFCGYFISQLFSFQEHTVVDSKSCNDQQETDNVNITYFFTKNNDRFNTAEDGDKVTKQGCATCTKFFDGAVPEQK